MRIAIGGGRPAGLSQVVLVKMRQPGHSVIVFEQSPPVAVAMERWDDLTTRRAHRATLAGEGTR